MRAFGLFIVYQRVQQRECLKLKPFATEVIFLGYMLPTDGYTSAYVAHEVQIDIFSERTPLRPEIAAVNSSGFNGSSVL